MSTPANAPVPGGLPTSLPPDELVGVFPASFAQQRLWFLAQLEPGNPFYNVPGIVRLSGRLDVPSLRRAFEEVVRRHETLRTVFRTSGDELAQVIHPPWAVPLPKVDLASIPGEARPAATERLLRELTRRPFDLARGPLIRVALVRLEAEEHVLAVTMHHIVTDGWSTGVLLEEVKALYDAYVAGDPSPLAALPIQYVDYADWQRKAMQGERLERSLAYWGEQLAGAPPLLELPADRSRPLRQSYRGAKEPLQLDRTLTDALEQLSRRAGATLFMTLLAGFDVLLCRQTGRTDLVVGTDVANRTREEIEGLIGFFVNQLVLRTDLSGDPTFLELLERVRSVCLAAYAHQDVPFEKVVEALNPARSLAHAPLFQVKLTLQAARAAAVRLAGLSVTRMEVDSGSTTFDLTLNLAAGPEGLTGWFEYNRDLFDAATVRRLGEQLRRLYTEAATDPGRRISGLALLSPAERRAIVAWNDRARVYPRDAAVHRLFEQQVRRTPEAVAVVEDGGGEFTYDELNRRANRLAHRLRELGIGPDVPVGICLERSARMVGALLAVLKAGGGYVPLDPTQPLDRLGAMIEDARVPLILTEERHVDALPARWARTLCLDGDAREAESARDDDPRTPLDGANLCYLFYTSGSTGRPKAVMVPHAALANHTLWMEEEFAFARDAVVLQKTPFFFDASVWEIFSPLAAGARLVLARPGRHPDPEYLVEVVERHGVSVLQVVPSQLRSLLAAGIGGSRTLRHLFCGGEPLPRELADSLAQSRFRVHNLYGPTEACIDALFHTHEPDAPEGAVPIGRPVSNVTAYVLDSALQPVPIGVQGELYLGGAGLARGYAGDPARTAERFLPDPFAAEGGRRLYRTGDLARYRPQGQIDFLGRTDAQVKLRGFRVELGEVEAALLAHPSVRECVVRTREDAPGDVRLVAYVVAEAGAETAGLRDHLRKKLPEHMVPSAFVPMERLPRTPGGKLDRGALPLPRAMPPPPGQALPAEGIESMVASVWADVLRVPRVGRHDNFFELGGHSLLATQVVSRLYDRFGVKMPLTALFDAPTVASLAAVVVDLQAAQRAAAAPAPAADPAADDVRAAVDRLSDAEVDRMLDRLAGRESEE